MIYYKTYFIRKMKFQISSDHLENKITTKNLIIIQTFNMSMIPKLFKIQKLN